MHSFHRHGWWADGVVDNMEDAIEIASGCLKLNKLSYYKMWYIVCEEVWSQQNTKIMWKCLYYCRW